MRSFGIISITFFCLLLFGSHSQSQEKVLFKIIVHSDNPESELTRQEISKLFLKKRKKWKNTEDEVLPVDLSGDSPVRINFSKIVHGRKVSAIKSYWQKKIFSGRDIPPPELASDESVLKYIETQKFSIGYVSESTAIDTYKVKGLRFAGP